MDSLASCIEHTGLSPVFTDSDADRLIAEALQHRFCGICLPPFWVKKAARELENTGIKTVTVVGFPLGYQRTESRLAETEIALRDGAEEIDVVINLSALKSGANHWVKADLARLAQACHQAEALLKVILETALLSEEEIRTACRLCEEAGADFVKTSTGFAGAGATVPHIRLMRECVGDRLGIKASGGIRDKAFALELIAAGADRIGTSAGVKIVS